MFFFPSNVQIFINQSVIKSNSWVAHIHAVCNCWSIETTIFISRFRYCLSKTLFYRDIYKISILFVRRRKKVCSLGTNSIFFINIDVNNILTFCNKKENLFSLQLLEMICENVLYLKITLYFNVIWMLHDNIIHVCST